MEADTRELQALIREYDTALRDSIPEVRKVVERGSLNIKNDAKGRISGHPTLRGLPHTISYDTRVRGTSVVGEIGPDKTKGGQAPLGNIAEYGTVNNAPMPFMQPAADEELPKFEKALEDLAVRLVDGR